MYVPPWTILAGLGSLERSEMCNLLASFEETTLLGMSADKLTDLRTRLGAGRSDLETTAFTRRIQSAAEALVGANISDKALRIRLWYRMLAALQIDPALPLSKRTANALGAAMSHKAAVLIGSKPYDDTVGMVPPTKMQRVWGLLKVVRGGESAEFSSLVADQAILATQTVTEAARSGLLDEEQKAELDQKVRDHIRHLPPELCDEAMRKALQASDKAALGLLVTGTSAFGIGLGVNLAGFGAYILAAKASAFIPLMSGPAVVSTLFLLSNPLFSLPALVGGAYIANRRVTGGQAARLASMVTVQLALRGLSEEQVGLNAALNDFRSVAAADFTVLPYAFVHATICKIEALNTRSDQALTHPHVVLANHCHPDSNGRLLDRLLAGASGDASEVATVASLTAWDILYNAVSIDPKVLEAADFSRSADIADIFQFGAFADRIGDMASDAAAGAENNLRGYVAEQVVAARLVEKGHIVSFPEASNNPGFDLLVDGHPFQVKCLLELSGLREHFGKYPDMPVYANSDLAEAVLASGESWAAKVFCIDGYDREIADLVMQTSLEAGDALGEFNLPYIAMAVSSARNLHRWWRGRISLSDLPASVVLDGSIKGGLAAIGGLSGKVLGLMTFGPAGALILGGIGGVGALLGSGWTREQASQLLSSEWLADLDLATDQFRDALIEAIQIKVDLLTNKRAQTLETGHPDCTSLAHRFSDDIISLGEALHQLRVDIPGLDQPTKARSCIEIMTTASVHPIAVQPELKQLFKLLGAQPSLTVAVSRKASEALTALHAKFPKRP